MLLIGRVAQPNRDQDQEDKERPGHFQQKLTCLSSSESEILPQQQPQLRPISHVTSAGNHSDLSVAGSPWRQRPELKAGTLWLVINCFPLLCLRLFSPPLADPFRRRGENKTKQNKLEGGGGEKRKKKEQSAQRNWLWWRWSCGAPFPAHLRPGREVSARLAPAPLALPRNYRAFAATSSFYRFG